MWHNLWTRAFAWLTKRDRGQRFEVRLIFDEEEATTGKCGPHNKIYGWAIAGAVQAMAREASLIPGIAYVEIIDRHMFWVQLQLKVFTLDSLDKPKFVEGKPISVIPETAGISIHQLMTETPPDLVERLKSIVPDVDVLISEESRKMRYKMPIGNDITIHRLRRVDADTDHFIARRGNDVLDRNGDWHNRERTYFGVTPFDSLLEVCAALLGEEFQQLEDRTNLWFDRDAQTRELNAPEP